MYVINKFRGFACIEYAADAVNEAGLFMDDSMGYVFLGNRSL